MTLPAYTPYSNRPRIWCRDTDWTALNTRTTSASAWKTLWDGTIIPKANSYAGQTPASIADTDEVQNRIAVLAFPGWLKESSRGTYSAKAIDVAKYLTGLTPSDTYQVRRYRLLAWATVFDLLFDRLTTTEKNQIAGAIIDHCGRMSANSDEYMDGHSGIDQVCSAIGALTVYGYSTYTTQAAYYIDKALTFWYGADSRGGRWEMSRWSYEDGGSAKGSWYTINGLLGDLWLGTALKNGTTDLDPFTAETWMAKLWEHFIWSDWSPEHDYEALGDTARMGGSAPMHWWQRQIYCILADRFPNPGGTQGGQMMRWLFDQWDALQSPSATACIWQIPFLDRASVASTAPSAATSPPARSRLFSPPGTYYGRHGSGASHWDYDNTVKIRIEAMSGYYLGHPHLNAGHGFLQYKDDHLLLGPAGMYGSYSDSHHVNAYQRSWLSSLVPLIYDPSEVYQRYSQTVANDGGQHFKKYQGSSDPGHTWNMLNDAGGQAWKRADFELVEDVTNYAFLYGDLTPAYKKEYTDSGRCSLVETKYLVIWPNGANGLSWPALLYYARIIKNVSDLVTQIPMHAYNAFTSQSYGATTTGYAGTGKLWIDIRDLSSYTRHFKTPGTPADANGYGPDQFKIATWDSTNWKPLEPCQPRELYDIKRYSMYVERTARAAEERYVALFLISGSGDGEPAASRTWKTDVEEPNWYGITIGSATYLLHRTQKQAAYGTGDTTPPGEVSSFQAAARDKALLTTWTDPVDSDYDHADIYYRTAAIP